MTKSVRRAVWLAVVGAVALTLILAPSGAEPARPEPGARTIVARAFGANPG